MADDKIRQAADSDGMAGGRRKGEENGLVAKGGINGRGALGGDDEALGGAAEQATHRLEAARAGDEDALADAMARGRARIDDLADGLVAGNEGIAEAGEGRHAAGPQEPLGAAADPGPEHVHDDVVLDRPTSSTRSRSRRCGSRRMTASVFTFDLQGRGPPKDWAYVILG